MYTNCTRVKIISQQIRESIKVALPNWLSTNSLVLGMALQAKKLKACYWDKHDSSTSC